MPLILAFGRQIQQVWSTRKVLDQPGLHRENLSQNKTIAKQNRRTSDCHSMLELFMIYLLLSELGTHGSKARFVSAILLWMTLNFEPSGLHILRTVILGFFFFVLFVWVCFFILVLEFGFWVLPLGEGFGYRVISCSLC